MKRLIATILAIGVVALNVWAGDAQSTQPKDKATATTKPSPMDLRARKLAEAKQAASECHEKIVAAYMKTKWSELQTQIKGSAKHLRHMDRQQRADVVYIRKSAKEHRPKWWKKCRSSSNTSFTARIWNRNFMANYMPTESIGFAAPVDIHRGRVRVIVSWQPNLVDNPQPAKGELAKRHGFTKGDIGEVVVWHELGHNYVTNFMNPKHVVELFRNHHMLFFHVQEFYADMTALYHCSPSARLALLMIRVDSLEWYRETECHTRAAYGIGSLLLTHFLNDPDKWPSIHLPPEVPKEDIERKTIVYVYEHIDPKWTLAEDKALRNLTEKFIRAKGELVLRRKGEILLPNRLSFKLMATDDRDLQPKRDAWVAEKLKAAIASGRADKPDKKKKDEWERGNRIEIPW